MTELGGWFLAPTVSDRLVDNGFPGNLTKSKKDFDGELADDVVEPIGTVFDFLAGRFVLRRGTMAGIGDCTIGEFELIVAIDGIGLIGKTGFMQGAVKPVAATIAREHSPRSVGTVRPRCQSHNQQPGFLVAKIGNRFSPIVPVTKGFTFFLCDRFGVLT